MRKTILAAILMALPSALFATAIADLEQATGADLRSLAQIEQNLQVGHKPNFAPRAPQDVLATCRDIDVVFVRQPALDEAVKTVDRCLQDRFSAMNKRRYSINAEKCTQAGCSTIDIIIRGELGNERPFVLEDLAYSLNKQPRNGKIHGWPAKIVELPARLSQTERHF